MTKRELDIQLWKTIGTGQHTKLVALYAEFKALRRPRKPGTRFLYARAVSKLVKRKRASNSNVMTLADYRSLSLPAYG